MWCITSEDDNLDQNISIFHIPKQVRFESNDHYLLFIVIL